MERAIAHMDLDTFFVSCERLKNSGLEKMPIIIGGGDRGVVASCSYEVRKFGVRSAMPIKMALRLCPEAKVIKGDMEHYSNMSHLATEVIQEKVPVLEKASIDEFYLDLSGMDQFFGCFQWTMISSMRLQKIPACRSALLYPLIRQSQRSGPVNLNLSEDLRLKKPIFKIS